MLSPVERKMSMTLESSNEDYKETIKFVSLKHCDVHKKMMKVVTLVNNKKKNQAKQKHIKK